MAEVAYTVHDSPNVVARIESDLDVVKSTLTQADPYLRSLILTGGFARGEGALLDGAPQNDYDFIAVRALGRPHRPYSAVRAELEARLGLHVDLAPVAALRLPWVSPSIFWYETALRGRVLWGEDLLDRIPVRSPEKIDPAEGLRLLANRAAGLLLVTESQDAHARRLQAAKAFLAALDAHMLAAGEFAPSQTERWQLYASLRAREVAPEGLEAFHDWIQWAYRFKVDPGAAPERDADDAWRAAARSILAAVPQALRHARLPSLEAYARRDGVVDHLIYYRRASNVPGARRLVLHPTARVRVATLRLLEASLDGHVPPEEAQRTFAGLARGSQDPLARLDALRKATLQ